MVVDLHLILSKSYHVMIDGITISFSHPQLGDGFRSIPSMALPSKLLSSSYDVIRSPPGLGPEGRSPLSRV